MRQILKQSMVLNSLKTHFTHTHTHTHTPPPPPPPYRYYRPAAAGVSSIAVAFRSVNQQLCSSSSSSDSLHKCSNRLLHHQRNGYTSLISKCKAVRQASSKTGKEGGGTAALSLDNIKVQQYLNRLKQEHEERLRSNDEATAQEARRREPLMSLLNQVERLQSDISELYTLAKSNEDDKEMQDLATQELQDIKNKLNELEEDIFGALLPPEPMDQRNVVVEVSAGVGGQEAMLFCQEVFDMYLSYAQHRGWQHEVTHYEETDIGGLRHGAMVVSGDSAYTSLKYEGGIHRVQRVPKTEKAGRVHTSTVSVAVLPQPTEIDIQLSDKDLKMETKKATGAGGQHVNTTDSAVRITHIPTGLIVESQSERSQHRNKENALKKLRAILYQQQLEQSEQEYSSNRKLQVGAKGRSEKIRTYNFPQDRITDHRIGVSVHNLTDFMCGGEHYHNLVTQLVKEGDRETLQQIINNITTTTTT